MTKELWLISTETRQLIKDIDKEITKYQEDTMSGALLVDKKSMEEVAKEYIYSVGLIDGLKYLKQYVENIYEQQSNTVSWEDEN